MPTNRQPDLELIDQEFRVSDEGLDAVLTSADKFDTSTSTVLGLVGVDDDSRAGEFVTGPDLVGESNLEPTQVLDTQPVGDVAGQHACLKHADGEHGREAGLTGERVVVVQRMEITRGTLILDEVGASQWRESLALGLLSGYDGFGRGRHFPSSLPPVVAVSMIVLFCVAISSPDSSRNSVIIFAKVITPPRFPGFSKRSPTV